MMMSQFQNRGRAYRCRHCNKIERKSRMVGHILKTHIPMDRVPFYCTLCSFRCEDRETLSAHISKYGRHRDEEAKRGTPDYTAILKKAQHPIYVGENDMVVLSREESLRWHARHTLNQEDPLEELDGLFEDDDEEATIVEGGRVIPGWMATSRPVAGTRQDGLNRKTLPSFVATTLPSYMGATNFYKGTVQSNKPSQCTNSNCFVTGLASTESNIGATGGVPQQGGSDLLTIDPKDFASLFSEANCPPQYTGNSTTQTLSTPVMPVKTPMNTLSTPCQDERGQENILDGLLNINHEDPLMREANNVTPFRVTQPHTKTQGVKDDQPTGDEPASKKQKTEELPAGTNTALDAIVAAITEGSKRISDAIDNNTRAIRCQDKTLDNVVGELARIERKLAMLERAHQVQETTSSDRKTTKGKENVKPTKGVVKKL